MGLTQNMMKITQNCSPSDMTVTGTNLNGIVKNFDFSKHGFTQNASQHHARDPKGMIKI
jgi:hypothetical protein